MVIITHEDEVAAHARTHGPHGRRPDRVRSPAVGVRMSTAETLRTALGAIAANRLRAGLTMLGLCIGVASVIALVAVGNGSKKRSQSSIDALGSNVLVVQAQPGGFGRGGRRCERHPHPEGRDALTDRSTRRTSRARPGRDASSTTLVAGSTSYSPSPFVGTTPSYATARTSRSSRGAMFTTKDVTDHAREVVIGPTVAENLFSGTSPVGQSIRVNGTSFTVVGVTASKGSRRHLRPGRRRARALDRGPGHADRLRRASARSRSRRPPPTRSTPPRPRSSRSSTSARTSPTRPTRASRSSTRARCARPERHDRRLHDAAGRGRRDLAAGGRDRRDEHHARLGHRAHARDRHPQGDRRAPRRRPAAVPGRGDPRLGHRRRARRRRRAGASHFEIAGVQPAVAGSTVALAFGAAVLCGLFFGTYPAARAARMRPVQALRFD